MIKNHLNLSVTAIAILVSVAFLKTPPLLASPVIKFNGSSTYIDIGSNKFPGLTNLTLEAWIKTTVIPANNTYGSIAGHSYLQGAQNGFGLYATFNKSIDFQVRNVTGEKAIAVDTPYPFDNVWHHVAGVRRGSDTEIYLNGVLIKSAPLILGSPFSSARNFAIGARDAGSWGVYFNGYIADVRLWGEARSASEIAALKNTRLGGNEPGLIGYWPLNDGTGAATAADLTAAANHGSIKNAIWEEDDTLPLHYIAMLRIEAAPYEYGTPTPPYGPTNQLAHLDTFTVSAPAGHPIHPDNPDIRAWCSGYAFYTNRNTAPLYSDTSTSFSYTHNTNNPLSILIWQWQEEYFSSFTAGAGGSVDFSDGWLGRTNITVTATPDGNSSFMYWEGNIPESQRFSPTLSFTPSEPVTAHAVFSHTVYHLHPDGDDLADGLSWAAARASLQPLLNTATPGTIIRLAGGTYSNGTTIVWTNSGISVIGGYAGSGATPDQYNPRQWPTIIQRGTSTVQRIMLLEHVTNSLLQGITLRHGNIAEAKAGAGLKIVACQSLNIKDTVITDNIVSDINATLKGAGLYIEDSSATFNNVAFRNNSIGPLARNSCGGGAAVVGGAVTFIECLFAGNELVTSGADLLLGSGLHLEGGAHTIRHSAFINNRSLGSTFANARGDGLHVDGGTVTAFNNLFSGNTRDAIHLANGTLDVRFATITTHGRYGLRRVNGALTVNDSIIWQTAAPLSGTITAVNCLTDTDPRFERGLCLAADSPAKNSASLTTSAAGLAGRSTAADGTLQDNADADLGYHFATAASFSYADDAIRHDPARAALYVAPAGDDEATGSESAPFATITHALSAAAAGSHIHIAPGLYTGTTETFPLQLTKPGLRLIGSNSATTTIHANGSINNSRRVLVAWGATGDAAISGLTLSGGYSIQAYHTHLPYIPENYRRNTRGGGLQLINSSLLISAAAITNNYTHGSANENTYGGGIFTLYAHLFMTNSLIARNAMAGSQSNTGTGFGGGIYLQDGACTIVDCDITDNNGGFANYNGDYGGGIAMIGNHVVKNSRITLNRTSGYASADRNGNGIYMTSGLVTHCLIASNFMATTASGSQYGGGGVYMTGGTLRNSLLIDNQTRKNGGAIFASGGLIESVTATRNESNLDATIAGLFISDSGPIVSNSIFYANTRTFDSVDTSISASGGTIAHSCTWPGRAGNGNTDLSPEFTNVAGDDFTPMAGSPVIDTAIAHGWMNSATDYYGNPRIRGTAPDMGAIEAPAADEGPLAANFVADNRQGIDTLEVTFTAHAIGSDTSGLTFYWDIDNDGVPDVIGADKEVLTHTFSPGYHTISLTVTNSSDEGHTLTKENYIWVSASEIYVWSGGSGYPGTSWATAFTNVQEAFNFSFGTNNIYIAGEIFDLTSELVFSSADYITIKGGYQAGLETIGPGPYDHNKWPTILRRVAAAGDFRPLSLSFLNHSRLERITLTGGNTPTDSAKAFGGGLYILQSTIDISDCTFSNNQVNASGNGQAWGGGIYANNSTVTISDSHFTRNVANSGGQYNNNRTLGGAIAAEASTINILTSRFLYNDAIATGHYGSWGGALYLLGNNNLVRNSLFVGNRAGTTRDLGEGGAIFLNASTVVDNSTFVHNTCYGNLAGAYTYHGAGSLYNNGGFVTNCLFWANSNTYHKIASDIGSVSQIRFAGSCALELNNGANYNISDDPLLLMAGTARYPQYSLTDASPCINAAIRLPWMENATDLAGNKRVAGGGADIGCYEKPAVSATILLLR